MVDGLLDVAEGRSIPIWPVGEDGLREWLVNQSPTVANWVESTAYGAKHGKMLLLPDDGGGLAGVIVGLGSEDGPDDHGPWIFAALAQSLAAGDYHIDAPLTNEGATQAALGWLLGGYSFDRYRKADEDRGRARFVIPGNADRAYAERTAKATFLVRDLINTPAADMGPVELAEAARDLARCHDAKFEVVIGETLESDFPAIHAVGKGSARAPRLIDLTWGDADAPRVTLVGKGVCFDSGGLDIKSTSGMGLMKKDMGGAAHALGLASMIMDAGLPVRLRVLVPAVENSISGRAYRPGDVIRTHKGITVEIGNTDAEGRLVLADALALADADKPDLLFDFATLTGAARVALGPDLPALFTADDTLASDLGRFGAALADPVWRLPLWRPYAKSLDSTIADINNISETSFAGAISAALFLEHFVDGAAVWAHFDLFGWRTKAEPGRPKGAEAQTIRAAFAVIEERFPA